MGGRRSFVGIGRDEFRNIASTNRRRDEGSVNAY